MKGHYKDKQATRETLKGGWLHTGDLARGDEESIYPREFEEVLYPHPKIQEAAVIGVPDQIWGESVKALTALREEEKMKGEEVIDYCKEYFAGYEKPKSVQFVEGFREILRGKSSKRIEREISKSKGVKP
jgi:acyl-CoA synthetase (AMP-forming)/AMP-acid ligase II